MSGVTAVKTLKMLRTMEKMTRQAMVTTRTKIMVALESKDAPKIVAVDLEHLLAAAVVAVPGTRLTMKVMNTIASSRRKVNKKRKRGLQVPKC